MLQARFLKNFDWVVFGLTLALVVIGLLVIWSTSFKATQLSSVSDVWNQMTFTVIGLVALVGLRATNPRYLGIFDGLAGQLVLLGCALSVAIGYAAMLYLTRLPGERRVLVR